jgi:hypothetical protein
MQWIKKLGARVGVMLAAIFTLGVNASAVVKAKDAFQKKALEDVKSERDYQDTIWNTDQRNDLKNETTESFFKYIIEYASNATVRLKPRTERERLIKVAALAVAAVERIDKLAQQARS